MLLQDPMPAAGSVLNLKKDVSHGMDDPLFDLDSEGECKELSNHNDRDSADDCEIADEMKRDDSLIDIDDKVVEKQEEIKDGQDEEVKGDDDDFIDLEFLTP